MLIIGVAGASASGKSLFAKTLYEGLVKEYPKRRFEMISLDSYYKDQSHLSIEHRDLLNWDRPDAFDFDLLNQHLTDLKEGIAIEVPIYDYAKHGRKAETRHIERCDVLVVEGILLFTDAHLLKHIDLKAFIDTPLDVCLSRRLRRDVEKRGRTMDSVLTQWEDSVRPMYYAFVKPTRDLADMMVPRGFKNKIAIDVIKARVNILMQQLAKKE